MNDQRVCEWSSLRAKDFFASFSIKSICSETIDSLRGEADQLTLLQNFGRFLDSLIAVRLYYCLAGCLLIFLCVFLPFEGLYTLLDRKVGFCPILLYCEKASCLEKLWVPIYLNGLQIFEFLFEFWMEFQKFFDEL